MRGYRRLKDVSTRPGQVKLRATMSHQNHDPLLIAEFFREIGENNFGIGSTLERVGDPQPTALTASDLEELDERFEVLLDEVLLALEEGRPTPTYNPFFRVLRAFTESARRPSIGCGICRNDQGIGTDGSIYPCHRYVGLRPWIIGNVHEGGIDPERERDVYRQFHDMWERHCRNCYARYVCSGACAWQHSDDDGRMRDPLEYLCQSTRKSVQRSGWLAIHMARHFPVAFGNVRAQPTAGGRVPKCCNPS